MALKSNMLMCSGPSNRILVALSWLLTVQATLRAQATNTSKVHVDIVDSAGAPLSDVHLRVEGNANTMQTFTVDGSQDLDLRAPDVYHFTASKAGYKQIREVKATVTFSSTPKPTDPKPIQMEGPPSPSPAPGTKPSAKPKKAQTSIRIELAFAFQDPRQPAVSVSQSCSHPSAHIRFVPANRGVARVSAYQDSDAQGVQLLRQTFTDADGNFTLDLSPDQAPRTFVLTITRPGYEPLMQDVTLCDVAGAGSYTLTAETPTETDSLQLFEGARRANFGKDLMYQLPLPGFREFDRLALLVPGVAPPPQTSGIEGPEVSPTVGSPGQAVVNGLSARQNNYTVDGSDNNDELLGVRRQGYVDSSPQPIESLDEFQVLTAAGDVQFGRGIGGQINAQTRSSSFELHGQAFGFLTSDWNGRDFFFQNISHGVPGPGLTRQSDGAAALFDSNPIGTRLATTGNSPYTRSDAGLAGGGTLRRLRLAYYGAYERRNSNAYDEYNYAVPTLAERAIGGPGGGPGDAGFRVSGSSFFPSTLPGNAVFSFYPFPNNAAGPYGANTYTALTNQYQRGRLYVLKLDRAIGSSGVVSGRYNRTSEHSKLPVTGGALDSAIAPRVLNQNLAFFINSPALALSPVRGARVSSVTRLSFGRTGMDFSDVGGRSPIPSDLFPAQPFLLNAPLILDVSRPGVAPTFVSAARAPEYMQAVGLPGVVNSESITGPLGQIEIGGFSPVGVDVFRFPQRRSDHTFQVANTASLNLARHSISYGVDVRRIDLNTNLNRNALPLAQFNGTYGNILSSQSFYIPAVSMAAAGIPAGLFQTLATSADDSLVLNLTQADLFITDRIRLTPHFYIDIGFRLGIHGSPGNLSERVRRSFNRQDFDSQITAAEAKCQSDFGQASCQGRLAYLSAAFPGDFSSLFQADRIGNDGRGGFAWDVLGNGRLAIRGGAGSYTGDFPLIVLSESRSVFPSYLPLNLANAPGYGSITPFGTPTAPYRFLTNLANPLLQAQDRQLQDVIQANTINQLTASAAADPVSLLGFGLNTLYPSLRPTSPASKLKHPYAFHYAFTVEGEIRRNLVLSMAYVGTAGRKLLRVTTPDAAFRTRVSSNASVLPLNVDAPFPFVVADMTPNILDRTPGVTQIAGLNPVGIYRTLYESSGSSSYHSLQIELRKSYSNRVQLGANLVYSHAIDDSSDFFDTAGEFAPPQNSSKRSERGSAAFDVRVRAAGFLVWDLPDVFAAGKSPAQALGHRLFGDWHLSGIWVAQSGQPYTINTSIDVNGDGNITDRLNCSTDCLTFHPSGDRARQVVVSNAANLLAPLGQDGAVGRNTFTGDRLYSMDLALIKSVRLHGEQKLLNLRFETFNALNHGDLGLPTRILESPGFGRSVSMVNKPRTLQVACKLLF
jgi:hypothetical protein